MHSAQWMVDGEWIEDVALGRDIGYQFARVGMTPPEDSPTAVLEGYAEGRYAIGRSPEKSERYERKLVRLRLSAYRRKRYLDSAVTPTFLRSIDVEYCPITRQRLTVGTDSMTDGTVDRVFNGGGYAVGNLAVMSKRANLAKGGLLPLEILEIAKNPQSSHGLSQLEWMRLACLTAMSAPPGYMEVDLPLLVYPPPSIMLTNGTTLLQQCASAIVAGFIPQRWESELRKVLHGKASKRSFDGLVESLKGQIARRVISLKSFEQQTFAVTDSWETDLVSDRFYKFIGQLTTGERAAAIAIAVRAQQLRRRSGESALETWNLETAGYS